MRTQFLYVGLLSMTLAGGLVSAGCDSNDTGHPHDPSGPAKLVRIMIMDDDTNSSGGRSYATDLLDTPGSPLTTAVACNDNTAPCIPQFNLNLGGSVPDWSCDPTTNLCFDPLAPTGTVEVQEPDGAEGSIGGTEIRLVFNKLLDANKIETVTVDPNALPGANETFTLNSGIVDLLGPDGTAVDTVQYWDPTGAPTFTSDVILNPFGPAITIKPSAPLLTNSQYTIVLHTNGLTDRDGNPVADQNGNVLTGDFKISFMTEGLTPVAITPDVSSASTKVATDAVIQFAFNADITDPSVAGNFTSTLTGPVPAGATLLAWIDQTVVTDPTTMAMSCTDTSDGLLDMTLVDATGAPVDWAPGDYTLTFSIKSKGGDTFDVGTTTPFMFTVFDSSTVKTGGATSSMNFTLPSQCP